MKEFKDILRGLRIRSNLSQSELSQQVFLSRSAIAKYENGLDLPGKETLERFCTLFGVEKAYFFPPEPQELLIEKNRRIRRLKTALSVWRRSSSPLCLRPGAS